MGEYTTDTPIDALALSFTTSLAPLTISGPDPNGRTLVECPSLTDAELAATVDLAGRTTIIDHGDGTGTRTTYDEHGNQTSVERLTDLPIPEPVTEEQTDPMLAQLAALGAALLADPDGFARMVSQVAGSNTAKGPLSYLADALKAAEQT